MFDFSTAFSVALLLIFALSNFSNSSLSSSKVGDRFSKFTRGTVSILSTADVEKG